MSSRKILITNLFSLSGIQIINYVVPILVVPYIVRIIGPEKYGLINFSQAFTTYFILIVNYGFEYSATREISINRKDKHKISEIFTSIIIAKCILFICTSLIFLLLIFYLPSFKPYIEIFLFTYLIIIGNIFLPIWLFQGLEKLTKLSVFNFFTKFIYALSIFIFIKERDDYLLIPLILSVCQIIIGIISFFYSIKVFNISITLVNKNKIIAVFKDGWKLFMSTILINLYTTTNILILGILGSNLTVGYFSASSKIVNIIQGFILGPISQAFFPRIGMVLNESKEKGILILKKLTFIVGLLMMIISILIFIFSNTIIRTIFGDTFMYASPSLRIISFLPFIVGLSNIFGLETMLNLKMDKSYLVLTFIGAILSIVLNIFLVPIYFENGTAISWLISEIFIAISFFVVLFKNNINLFDFSILKSSTFNLKSIMKMLKKL